MAFDLETYKRSADRLDVADLDFDAFRDQPLAPDHLRCLRYMHDVENHTSCYLRNLLNTRAHHDPEITTFLTLWNHEELWHGEALGRVLAAHDEPGGSPRVATMRRRLGWRITASPLLWMAFSAATPNFLAVHMTFGAINEWTTQAGYVRLAAEARHPVLDELLRRIMRQEGTHIAFYRSHAVERLEASRAAQRTTRRLVRALWSPVGASVMPEEETRHLVRTLFSGDEGRAVAERIDRRVDGLPGLAGLGLMAGALARYG
ncbi:MAG: ferritin-like domain-containing protein [Acidimicrobiia bacterium]